MEKFNFFIPAEITKAKDKNGNDVMKIGGIASTADIDSDEEILEPSGYDLNKLLKSGFINWHHQSKSDPTSIIGEPTKAYVKNNKLFLEGILYPESEMARKVYEIAKILEKSSPGRRLGFSIEGKPMEYDPFNKKRITKASITGVAITHSPKNSNTLAQILKGEVDDLFVEEYSFEKGDDGFIYNEIDENGDNVKLTENFDIIIEKAQTSEGSQENGLAKESLEGNRSKLKSKLKENIDSGKVDLNKDDVKEAIVTLSKAIEQGLI